jgi:hypothetical protein
MPANQNELVLRPNKSIWTVLIPIGFVLGGSWMISLPVGSAAELPALLRPFTAFFSPEAIVHFVGWSCTLWLGGLGVLNALAYWGDTERLHIGPDGFAVHGILRRLPFLRWEEVPGGFRVETVEKLNRRAAVFDTTASQRKRLLKVRTEADRFTDAFPLFGPGKLSYGGLGPDSLAELLSRWHGAKVSR